MLKDYIVIYESRNNSLDELLNFKLPAVNTAVNTTVNISPIETPFPAAIDNIEEIENIDNIDELKAWAKKLKPQILNKKNKVKYTCPECKVNIWGKPYLNILCGDCGIQMSEVERQGSLV